MTKWTPTYLKGFSLKGDDLADEIIAKYFQEGGIQKLNEVFDSIHVNKDLQKDRNISDLLENYLQDVKFPEWADLKKVELAQKVFADHGPSIAMLLNFKALPLCYSCGPGAKVLYSTGRMAEHQQSTKQLHKRLMETAKMIFSCMSPGGFSEDGKGIATIKKVRLLHASIRYFLKHPKYNPKGWDVEKLGEPLNQEQLAGTLMSFSAMTIYGLKQLGIDLTDEEADAYVHTWNIIGYLIGVDPALYPSSAKDGWDLGVAIVKRNYSPSYEGKMLTKALLELNESYFKSRLMKAFPSYFMGYFMHDVAQLIDEPIAEDLNIAERDSWFNIFMLKLLNGFFHFVDEAEDRFPLIEKVLDKINLIVLGGMIDFTLANDKDMFDIPSELAAAWKIEK